MTIRINKTFIQYDPNRYYSFVIIFEFSTGITHHCHIFDSFDSLSLKWMWFKPAAKKNAALSRSIYLDFLNHSHTLKIIAENYVRNICDSYNHTLVKR